MKPYIKILEHTFDLSLTMLGWLLTTPLECLGWTPSCCFLLMGALGGSSDDSVELLPLLCGRPSKFLAQGFLLHFLCPHQLLWALGELTKRWHISFVC